MPAANLVDTFSNDKPFRTEVSSVGLNGSSRYIFSLAIQSERFYSEPFHYIFKNEIRGTIALDFSSDKFPDQVDIEAEQVENNARLNQATNIDSEYFAFNPVEFEAFFDAKNLYHTRNDGVMVNFSHKSLVVDDEAKSLIEAKGQAYLNELRDKINMGTCEELNRYIDKLRGLI